MNKFRVALISALLVPAGAMAAGDDLKLNVGGFIWAQAGTGDRYETGSGVNKTESDQLGVKKAAISISPEYQNTRAVVVFGVDDLFNEDKLSNGADSGNVGVVEAFAGIKFDLLGGSLDTTIGKQPLLFGLKPNGWVGDRSIQQGLEFGSGNPGPSSAGINVSGQVNDALILDWSWGGDAGGSAISSIGPDGSWSIRFGLFQTDQDFSSSDNFFFQARGDDLLGLGLYGNAGYEQLEVGNAANSSSEGIFSVGAGWRWQMLDLSLEYQGIDQAIAEMNYGLSPDTLTDDESQIIAEATLNLNESWSFYLDYATADEADVDTIRLGGIWMVNQHTDLTLEYSDDSYGNNTGIEDDDSIDLRLSFNF